MIQKAIIESVLDDYTVKIRIPKYDKTYLDGMSYKDLSTGIICSMPGTNVIYSKGDVVLVGFENDEIGKPVILGLLYTEQNTESSVQVLGVDETLNNVEETLTELTDKTYYTHIKYSNDAGTTFTSLYDYSDRHEKNGVYYCDNIIIDRKSTFIKWDILDNTNANAIDKFKLEVTIHNGEDSYTATGETIEIPDTYNYADELTIDYSITPIDVNISDYNIALYTDRNPLGTTEGDYVGILNSDSYIPSLNPVDYAWLSIKTRIQKFIDEASDNVIERVRIIERYLYGKTYEETEDTKTGINSAVEVTTESLEINKKQRVKMSKNIYLDTKNNSIFFNRIALVAGDNGHLTIK